MQIDGMRLAEFGLKALLLLFDMGFLLMCVLFQVGAWREVGNWRKSGRFDKGAFIMFFVFSVIFGLIAVSMFGLLLTRWWT